MSLIEAAVFLGCSAYILDGMFRPVAWTWLGWMTRVVQWMWLSLLLFTAMRAYDRCA